MNILGCSAATIPPKVRGVFESQQNTRKISDHDGARVMRPSYTLSDLPKFIDVRGDGPLRRNETTASTVSAKGYALGTEIEKQNVKLPLI